MVIDQKSEINNCNEGLIASGNDPRNALLPAKSTTRRSCVADTINTRVCKTVTANGAALCLEAGDIPFQVGQVIQIVAECVAAHHLERGPAIVGVGGVESFIGER